VDHPAVEENAITKRLWSFRRSNSVAFTRLREKSAKKIRAVFPTRTGEWPFAHAGVKSA